MNEGWRRFKRDRDVCANVKCGGGDTATTKQAIDLVVDVNFLFPFSSDWAMILERMNVRVGVRDAVGMGG